MSQQASVSTDRCLNRQVSQQTGVSTTAVTETILCLLVLNWFAFQLTGQQAVEEGVEEDAEEVADEIAEEDAEEDAE